MRPLLLAVVVAAGCAPHRTEPDPFALLRVGVDPAKEARAVRRSFAQTGYQMTGEVRGAGFRALGFVRPDGASAVRIVTRRGIEVALDAPDDEEHGRVRVSLLAGKLAGHDLDGDGHPEVPVAVVLRPRGKRCIGLVRIYADGAASEVAVDPGHAVNGACIERLSDVGGDGRPEALVVERHPGLTADLGSAPPTVMLPLKGRAGAWGPALGPAYARYWTAQMQARHKALERARHQAHPADALRIAVELAAIARLRGADTAAQIHAFDEALRGVVLPEAVVPSVDCVRKAIARGWPRPEPTCYTPRSHGP